MTETSREELEVVSKKLQDQIDQVVRKVSLIPAPFSKLSMLQVRKGGTGAARFRKLDLPWLRGGTLVTDSSGGFSFISHRQVAGGSATTHNYGNVSLPEDAVAAGTYKLKILYSNAEVDNSIDIWILKLGSLDEGGTSSTILYSDSGYVSKTVSSVLNTLTVLSYDLTTLPKSGSTIQVGFGRDGTNDSNNGTMDIWAVWLEYLAFI